MRYKKFSNYFLLIAILMVANNFLLAIEIDISKDSLINSTPNSIRRIRDEPNGLSLRLKEIISEVKPYGLIKRLLQDQFIQENKDFFTQIQMLAHSDLSRRKRLRIADEIIERHEIKDTEIRVYLKLAVSYQVAKEEGLITEKFIESYPELNDLSKEIVRKVDPAVLQIFEENLKDADSVLKQRVALILLFAKDKGTQENIRWQINGRFDTEAAEIMMKIARTGITEEKWYKIFKVIEYFADVYYLNRLIKDVVEEEHFIRKAALSEMLNAQFLEKIGYKDYGVELLTFSLKAWERRDGLSDEINGIEKLRKENIEEVVIEVKDFYKKEDLEEFIRTRSGYIGEIIRRKLNSLVKRLEQEPYFSFKGKKKEIKNKRVIFIFSISNPNISKEESIKIVELIKEEMEKYIAINGLLDIIENVIYGDIDKKLIDELFKKGLP